MAFTSKKTSELSPGDVVRTHGMRLLIEDAPSWQGHPSKDALNTDALVLNRDEVAAHGFVPLSWLDREDGSHRWMIQGNDLASWSVEA